MVTTATARYRSRCGQVVWMAFRYRSEKKSSACEHYELYLSSTRERRPPNSERFPVGRTGGQGEYGHGRGHERETQKLNLFGWTPG